MRILFSTTAGAGHFGPLTPFARACADARHEVRVAAPASFADSVAAAGLIHAPFDDVPPEVMGAVFGRLPELPRQEADKVVISEVFGRLDAQAALPGVTAAIDEFRPDVVISEPAEFASWAAAERAGIPQIIVTIGLAAMTDYMLSVVGEPLAELRAIADLPPDPDLDRLRAIPTFTLVPPSLDGATPGPNDAPWRFRDPVEPSRRARLPPAWGDPGAPLVYVTFGSVTATIPPLAPIFAAVLDALSGTPHRVLVTTGEGLDPTTLGPRPANVHIERWWPQADVMPACAAVVGHGGFGTTMLTLVSGLPQVVMPLFASDQFLNGARVDEVGAGICLEGGPEAAGALPGHLRRVLDEPSYRETARQIAAETATLPEVSTAVTVIEELAGGGAIT